MKTQVRQVGADHQQSGALAQPAGGFALGPESLQTQQRVRREAEQVTRIRDILEGLSLEIASPDEARERLQLKGGDLVGF